MKSNLDKSIEFVASRLAEIRLSELGYRFIPGIYPIIKRFRQLIFAKALIIKAEEVAL